MRKMLCVALLQAIILNAVGQNVGVNTQTPVENLQVDSCIKVGKNQTLTGLKKNIIKFGDDAFVTIGEEVGDDKMYLRFGTMAMMRSDNSIGNGFVGVQTETPTNTLDVNGSLRLRGNGAAAGKTLTSDANGVATWSGPVVFAAKRTGASLPVPGFSTSLSVFTAVDYETVPGGLSFGPNKFTAPVSGYYHFSGNVDIASTGTQNAWRLLFNGNNGSRQFDMESGPTNGVSLSFAFDYKLNAGEAISPIFVNLSSNAATVTSAPEDTFFMGHLIR